LGRNTRYFVNQIIIDKSKPEGKQE